MRNRNGQWLPIVASVGIGAAAYSMMTGRSGQLPNMIPGMNNMAGGNSQQNQQNQS